MSVILDFETDTNVSIDVMSVLSEKQDFTKDDVEIFLVKINNPVLANLKPSFERKIWGRSMLDWVKIGLGGKVNLTDEENFLEKVKQNLTNKPITMIAFSDTPLLTPEIVGHMLGIVNSDFSKIHNFNRVYMGPTKLFKSVTVLPSEVDKRYESLLVVKKVDDFVSLATIETKLRERIIYAHMKRGVHFLDKDLVQIDVDVEIGKNVRVGMCNILRGKTKICDNVVLEANNVISDSEIGDNVRLIGCIITKSKIGKNSVINPFSVIESGKLKGEKK